jgi:hypothetical protein
MGSRLEKKSKVVRKLIENHVFDDEDGEEYGASKFCGVGDYIRRKKIKLQNLDNRFPTSSDRAHPIFLIDRVTKKVTNKMLRNCKGESGTICSILV